MNKQCAYIDNIVDVRIDTFDGQEYFEASIQGHPDFVEYDTRASVAKNKLIKRFTDAIKEQSLNHSRAA